MAKLTEFKTTLGVNFECKLMSEFGQGKPLTCPQGSCLILDESDETLLDAITPLNAKVCVGLTATAVAAAESMEADYLLGFLGFQYFDSGIQSDIQHNKAQPIDSIEAFIDSELGYPMIIYSDEKTLI